MLEITEIIKEIQLLEGLIETQNKKKNELQAQLLEFIDGNVSEELSKKEYGCGTVNVPIDGNIEIKATVNKKITWDQGKLRGIYEEIQKSGDNPNEFIKARYNVSEVEYKAWSDDMKEFFEEARTVQASEPKLKIIEKNGKSFTL